MLDLNKIKQNHSLAVVPKKTNRPEAPILTFKEHRIEKNWTPSVTPANYMAPGNMENGERVVFQVPIRRAFSLSGQKDDHANNIFQIWTFVFDCQ